MFEGCCSRLNFIQTDTCIHHNAFLENESNRMRTLGIATRIASPRAGGNSISGWETYFVPFDATEDVRLMFVFSRNSLSSAFTTPAID